ncbi:hypothetical protein FQN55_008165 [Onygenales sp. PD_40]|nr:hypothetical protein FQN55_008165 [Onygenales sp. PD_40]
MLAFGNQQQGKQRNTILLGTPAQVPKSNLASPHTISIRNGQKHTIIPLCPDPSIDDPQIDGALLTANVGPKLENDPLRGWALARLDNPK